MPTYVRTYGLTNEHVLAVTRVQVGDARDARTAIMKKGDGIRMIDNVVHRVIHSLWVGVYARLEET